MEMIFILGILAAFVLGAWVGRGGPAAREKPPEQPAAEARAARDDAKPEGDALPHWKQVDNIMNYNGSEQN